MPRDSYTVILKEIKELAKRIPPLRAKTLRIRERILKARDNAQIEKIRKELRLK